MREAEVAVVFLPSEKTVHVLPGTTLLEAAAGADIVVDQPCGGSGICGKCRVIVSGDVCEPTDVERESFSEEELLAGCRLACQSTVCGPIRVEVPPESLLGDSHKILARSAETAVTAADSPIRKEYVEMPRPARGDADADLVRLETMIQPFRVDLDLVRHLPQRLRECQFRGTAVLAHGELIDFEPHNTEAESYAVAVDVGTTTLVAVLLDLHAGKELAVASRLNPQTRFGDDVLSRILYGQENANGLGEMQEAIIKAIGQMIDELVRQASIARRSIYAATFSGNTTMQQLLCRIDPSPLGKVPFVPAVGRAMLIPAAKLGLQIHPRARAYVMPVIGGFVGGDTVSGILATSLADGRGPTLLVDIGTNGEIVLFSDGKLTAASTAAGPAFEGARISQGMRGCNGAIEKVVVNDRLRINVIGDVPPVGLCGSGLIDTAGELLRHGLLAPNGRLLPRDELPDGLLADLAERVVDHEGKPAFCIADETEAADGKPILLTQRDVRELQLATGAIRAGIAILLKRGGVDPASLENVLIAGGFGNFIRRSNAQRIGLMPCEVERRRILYQGNTALAGARLTALSQKAREMADQLARRTEHVDLSTDPDFQTTFADAMIFPEE